MTITERVAVPLLDLKAQYAGIRDEIHQALDRVLESQHFFSGQKLRRLKTKSRRTQVASMVSVCRLARMPCLQR